MIAPQCQIIFCFHYIIAWAPYVLKLLSLSLKVTMKSGSLQNYKISSIEKGICFIAIMMQATDTKTDGGSKWSLLVLCGQNIKCHNSSCSCDARRLRNNLQMYIINIIYTIWLQSLESGTVLWHKKQGKCWEHKHVVTMYCAQFIFFTESKCSSCTVFDRRKEKPLGKI
jgi:hypothetical protein